MTSYVSREGHNISFAAPANSAKRQKLDRETTAAFSASQPLFDTLRNARDTLPAQGLHLTAARDIVQQIHVSLAIDDGNNDIHRHASYMDAIVRAWRSAAETYRDILTHLTNITAPKPSEGRKAAVNHQQFKTMLETAQRAQSVAAEYLLAEVNSAEREQASDNGPRKTGGGANPSLQRAKAQHQHPTPPTSSNSSALSPKKNSSISTKFDKSGTRVLWQNSQLKVPHMILDSDEKREWHVVQKQAKRQQRKKQVAAIATTVSDGKSKKGKEAKLPGEEEAIGYHHLSSAIKNPPVLPLAVEYEDAEDVSKEVQARLQAKRELKMARRAEKKRKRQSGGSLGDACDAPATPVPQAGATEKPSKKKVKREKLAEVPREPEANNSPTTHSEKRRQSVDVESAAGASAGKPNYKKSKTSKD